MFAESSSCLPVTVFLLRTITKCLPRIVLSGNSYFFVVAEINVFAESSSCKARIATVC